MKLKNTVFVVQSLDGYIGDKNNGLEWLEIIPNPEYNNMVFRSFMERMDAIIMGCTTFETVVSFRVDWPYSKPVFVLSNTLKFIPDELKGKVEVVNGTVSSILSHVRSKGHWQLYIDGGATIHAFLKEDLIDELIITTMPIVQEFAKTVRVYAC